MNKNKRFTVIVTNKYLFTTKPFTIYCGRGSVLGNPYIAKDRTNFERDRVCELYEKEFDVHNKSIKKALKQLWRIGVQYGVVELQCFCKTKINPTKRCHCDTIKKVLIRRQNKLFPLDIQEKTFSGVGSRQTPEEQLNWMTKITTYLYSLGFILNSGAAEGADKAFEKGVPQGSKANIFIPWYGYNKRTTNVICDLHSKHFALAESLHPAWNKCSLGVKKLHARNTQQVLGKELQTPVKLLIAYAKEIKGVPQGGTATAIKLAQINNIPVINLWQDKFKTYQDLVKAIDKLVNPEHD